ncbi:MAG: DUF6515 family protein [Ferruginibacter sp.]
MKTTSGSTLKKASSFAGMLLVMLACFTGLGSLAQGNREHRGDVGGRSGSIRQQPGGQPSRGAINTPAPGAFDRSRGAQNQEILSNRQFNRGNQNRSEVNRFPAPDRNTGMNRTIPQNNNNTINGNSGSRPGNSFNRPGNNGRFGNGNINSSRNNAYNRPGNNYNQQNRPFNRPGNNYNNNYNNNNRSNNYYNGRGNNNYRRPSYSAYNPNWRYAYAPRRNSIYNSLPSSYFSVNFGGFGYRYYDGIFYRPYNNIFRVVAPPIGIYINVLPLGYSRIYVHDYPYYYYNGTYYDYRDDRYTVVSPPVGAIVESIPDGFETLVVDGETYYVADGAQYKPVVQENGEIWYEVIKANT